MHEKLSTCIKNSSSCIPLTQTFNTGYMVYTYIMFTLPSVVLSWCHTTCTYVHCVLHCAVVKLPVYHVISAYLADISNSEDAAADMPSYAPMNTHTHTLVTIQTSTHTFIWSQYLLFYVRAYVCVYTWTITYIVHYSR